MESGLSAHDLVRECMLRRAGPVDSEAPIEVAGLMLDPVSHRVTIDESAAEMGPTEYRLLEVLLRNPDRVFERDQLLDRVWGRSTYIETRTVDVHILRLRKLLKPYGLDRAIQTVRSVGYRFSSSD